MSFGDWVDGQLDTLRAADQWREFRTFDALGPRGNLDGRSVISFASNDYLGLSHHPAVIAAAQDALARWGAGATSSRHVVGHRPAHQDLEEALAEWKGTARALTFSSGFAVNLGVLATFGGPDCLIASDELNHASIIDGCRLSRSTIAVARHNDVDHVAEILESRSLPRAIVIADAVFSMDGDEAPVDKLAIVCRDHDAMLVLDEAHSVFGPDLSTSANMPGLSLLRVATLSKTLGAMGGAVCGSASHIELLINRCRPLIFSTGLSPATAAAAHAAIDVVRSQEGEQRLAHLRKIVDRLRPGHVSPIVPIMVGAEAAALDAAQSLLDEGILVPAIRPPTVAPGTARLRVALSSDHTHDDVDHLIEALTRLGLQGS